MSGANYEYCPVCDRKALYVGDEDIPAGVVVLHKACADQERSRAVAAAAAAERERVTAILAAEIQHRRTLSGDSVYQLGKLADGLDSLLGDRVAEHSRGGESDDD